MQKELTVDAILEREPQYVQKFIDATRKEYKSWVDWGAIRKLSAAEAEAVRKDRLRILDYAAAFFKHGQLTATKLPVESSQTTWVERLTWTKLLRNAE
eukprot:6327150-Amphidinium_carterae.1